MINVILCGGSGSRLWPLSRSLMPKQFIKLFDNKSLFQLTTLRNSKLCESTLLVANSEQYFLALDQLEEIQSKTKFLIEPIPRNTAAAITLACLTLNPDELVLVTPSDHLIKDEDAYSKAIQDAEYLANKDYLVTFGIKPTHPETGFGYIEYSDNNVVKGFHEKPDYETAVKYVESEKYLWNSGFFMFKAGILLNEISITSAEIYKSCVEAFEKSNKDEPIRIKHDEMSQIPSNSIDYAVFEKSDKVKVVACDIGWSDLGSFDALHDNLPKNQNGNTENINHISINSHNNLIYGNDRKIATIDIDNCIIVDTGDALLVSQRGSSQKVRQVVEELKRSGSELHNIHLTGHRPWGTYTVLEDSEGYKIKRIEVKPGKRLSLQKHFHRNEHWIVVSGTATVTVGDQTKLIRPNESTFIKMGDVHRLSNEGKIPIVLVEVQVGEYTGEDDIVRLSDDFKRT